MIPGSWPWGVIPIREKELKELEEKAEKLEELKAKITQLHECLGEYESHLWCEHCIADTKCAQITMAVNELTETRKRLAGELLIADGKLEAVKTHLTKWKSGHSDWQMGRMSQWKKELDEILEEEGR